MSALGPDINRRGSTVNRRKGAQSCRSSFPQADVQHLSSGRICKMLINEPRNVWCKLDDEVVLAAVQHVKAGMGK